MRTTVSIDDHLLEAAKRRARERGVTLGSVVEDALRHELSRRPETEPRSLPAVGKGGLVAGVATRSNAELLRMLDEEAPPLRVGER